jgi:ATP synthase protein I
MSDDRQSDGRKLGEISPADRDALQKRASELGRQLDSVRAAKEPAPQRRAQNAALSLAFRFVVDLIVGIGVGGFIGWTMDRYLGTGPWGLIVFLLLGFTAGMVNMMRAASKEQAKHPAPKSRPVADDDDGR